MGLLDSYFDPDQFNPSGGLIGRLQSLQQQQGQYQPAQGFDESGGQSAQGGSSSASGNAALPAGPGGPTGFMKIGDYQMPQFGSTDVSQIVQPIQPTPGLGDRLTAGSQSWAHTPLENPFAALANGIKAFGAGQPTEANGLVPSRPQMPAQALDPDGRLSAGFQSWAHTPTGNPFAALANGIAGFESGRRIYPAPTPQGARARSEVPQSPSPVIQDATLGAMKPQTANKPASRVMAGPIMPRANPWQSRYGR